LDEILALARPSTEEEQKEMMEMVENAVASVPRIVRYCHDARWDVVGRAMDVLLAGYDRSGSIA